MFREFRNFVQDGIVEVMDFIGKSSESQFLIIKSRQIFSLLTSQKSCAVEVICKNLKKKSYFLHLQKVLVFFLMFSHASNTLKP